MTNFPFNDTIPATNNNPSNDQPGMLINNESEQSIWDVDHVGYNQNNGGTHDQVTFSSNNVPTVPTTFPVAFTNNVGGVPQLFFYPLGNAGVTSDQYASASNYSTYILNGLIIKGGTIGLSSSPQTITYSALMPALNPFPTATLSVFLFPANSNARSQSIFVSAVSATGFTVTGNSPSPSSYYFLAIGN